MYYVLLILLKQNALCIIRDERKEDESGMRHKVKKTGMIRHEEKWQGERRNDKEKWEKDVSRRKRGGLLDLEGELLFLCRTLSSSL